MSKITWLIHEDDRDDMFTNEDGYLRDVTMIARPTIDAQSCNIHAHFASRTVINLGQSAGYSGMSESQRGGV